MSTKEPGSTQKHDPKNTAKTGNSGPAKKRKSAGFIEITDFKPNWLETGPLSPDMLPESLTDDKTQLTPDEYDALQLSLQRFYSEAEGDTPGETASQAQNEATGEGATHTKAGLDTEAATGDVAIEQLLPSLLSEALELEKRVAESGISENEPIDWMKIITDLNIDVGSTSDEDHIFASLIPDQPVAENVADTSATEPLTDDTPSDALTAGNPTADELATALAAAEIKMAEARATEAKVTKSKAAEARADEIRAAEAKAAEMRAAEARAAEARAAEMRAAEARAAEAKAAEVRAAEAKAAEAKAAEVRAAEAKAAQARAGEAKAAEAKAAETQAADIFAPDVIAAAALAADAIIEDQQDFEDYTEEVVAPELPVLEPIAAPAKSKRVKGPKVKKRRDSLSATLLITSLLLLAAAAFIYFVNPFSRLALGTASLARPVSSPTTPSPEAGSGDWCLQGEFLPESAAEPRLIDSGGGGDLLAADRIFSLEYAIPQPGTYEWQVIDCANPQLAYPAAPAWVTTTAANQAVTFNFDSNERADRLFFPIPYVVSADDGAEDFRVLGNFQDWNPDDTTGQLQRINLGLFQQVRRIARAGTYEAYVIAGEEEHAVDAYGRTTQPIPFSFQTDRNGDYVVFLVDTDRGRASVMYDMPPLLTSLAYGNGNWILSLTLAGLALLLLLGMLLRLAILRNRKLQMETGCPSCGRQELMRISRRPADRLLHLFGIPAYRYRCRHCTWEGVRLSEQGVAVSSGVALAHFDGN